MVIRFYKDNQPLSLVVLPLLGIVFWLHSFLSPQAMPTPHAMPLFDVLQEMVKTVPFLQTLLAFVFTLLAAWIFNYIVNTNELLSRNSNLPALFYLLFASCDSSCLNLVPIQPAILFILLMFSRLLSSYRKDNAFSNVFDASLLLGIATLFYFPSLVFLIFILLSLIVLRPFIWREWILVFIGFLIPFAFAFVVYFWIDKLDYLWFDKIIFPALLQQKTFTSFDAGRMTMGYTLLFFIVLAFFNLIRQGDSQKVKTIKANNLLTWLMVFGGFSFLINPDFRLSSTILLAPTFAIFMSHWALYMKRGWLMEFVFLLMTGAVLYNLY